MCKLRDKRLPRQAVGSLQAAAPSRSGAMAMVPAIPALAIHSFIRFSHSSSSLRTYSACVIFRAEKASFSSWAWATLRFH